MVANSKIVLNALKAVSDEVRIRILNILSLGAFNVNEIQDILDMGQSRVSRHLKILENANLISSQREGTWVYYKLKDDGSSQQNFEHGLVCYLLSYKNILPNNAGDQSKTKSLIDIRQEKNNRFFNKIGKDLEKILEEIINPEIYRDKVLSLLPDKIGVSIDLGCGIGGLIPILLQKSNRVIGVDTSQKMVLEVSSRFKDNPNVEIIESKIEILPFQDEIADTVVAAMVLHHVSNPLLVIQETFRILKKQGRLFIIEFKKHNKEFMRERYSDLWLGFNLATLIEWLELAGFKVLNKDIMKTNSSFQIIIIQAIKNGEQNDNK